MDNEDAKPYERYQKIYRLIFWVGYVLVFAAALIPLNRDLHKFTIGIASFKFHFDQFLHVVVYLMICLYFSVGKNMGLTLFKDNSYNRFLIMVLILATITEVIQLTVPSRSFNVFDWLSNLIGIGIGLLLTRLTGIRNHNYFKKFTFRITLQSQAIQSPFPPDKIISFLVIIAIYTVRYITIPSPVDFYSQILF